MRKYQQLALLIISGLSVVILLLYKNENQRLKDVLQVVNIFGRTDEAVLRRLENSTTDDDIPNMGPTPVWQALSENYHAYGVFWNRNELIAGGEVLAIVVGNRGAVVNFGCSLLYDDGNRNVRGKFHFQRADTNKEDENSEFTIYYFFCKIVRDFGSPVGVVFNDITNNKHIAPELRIRHVKPLSQPINQNSINVCVNLVTANRTKTETHLMQFFLHHQGLGIMDFLVYNGDEMPQHVTKLLRHFNLRLHALPFNFPFSIRNSTERIRKIIETDCLIRNTNVATFTMLLEPIEFFYPHGKIDSSRSVLKSLHQKYSAGDISRFELPMFSVCVDKSKKLLIDNTLYDPEIKTEHKVFVYRALVPVSTVTALTTPDLKIKSIALPLSMAFAHRYVDCVKVGKDGLHYWRNSVREDFMNHLQEQRNELDLII